MIVTCERCETQFQLDEARVPASGARVRCSRCKHAFVVQAPAATEEERVHDAARQALETGGTPDAARDLPAGKDENEESDWQFNDDRGLDAADGESDFGEVGPDEDLCLASGDDDGEPVAAADSPPFERDESAFDGSADSSIDLPIDRDAVGGHDDGPDPFSAPTSGSEEGLDLFSAPASAADGGVERSPSLASEADSGRQSDELGSPGDWDLFDAPVQSAAPSADRVTYAPAAGPFAVVTTREAAGAGASTPVATRAPRTVPPWIASSSRVAGWLATAGLCVVGFSRGLAPQAEASPEDVVPASGIALEDVEGRWVDNVHLGKLFVVSGWMRREGAGASSRPSLELALLDGSGRVVGPTWPLDATRSQALLRAGDSTALEARQAGSLRPLAPGEKRSFEVVAWPLPGEAQRFEIRAAGESR